MIIAAMAGIVLVFSSQLLGNTKPQETEKSQSSSQYAKQLETKLTGLLEGVSQVGEVSIMITMENSGEEVYAQKEKYSGEDSVETEVVLTGGYSGQNQPLVKSTIEPKVLGVAVVCSGGDKPQVKTSVTEIVSTVLGISSNRVSVTKSSE